MEGYAVTQSVLRYKPEGRGFNSRCLWHFQLVQFLRPHYSPGVDPDSRNILGDKCGRCL